MASDADCADETLSVLASDAGYVDEILRTLVSEVEAHEPLRKGSSAASERTASDEPDSLAAAESQPLGSAAATIGTAELQPHLSQPQHDITPSQLLITPPDAPGILAKTNKLLALKQRRLGSLSSSLDLSRESSFDVSALHTGLDDAASSQQNGFAPSSSHEQLLLQNESVLNEQASTSLACLEGRRVSLQRRTSSIARKPSTVTDMFPSFDETRGRKQKHMLPAIQQPYELSVPLKEATATAKSSQQMQQILMQRHQAVVREQKARQHRREATERLQHAQILEALLNESSERRAALEARQAARAAQLLARQERMAAAAQARREERLQRIGQGHLSPAPKPVTRKEELDQLRRIEDAESELRRLLAEHKQMYSAQDQQRELDQQQQQAAVQRVDEARQHHRRRELDKRAANSWGFQAPSERRQPAQKASTLPNRVSSRQAGPAEAQMESPSRLYDERAAAQQALKREALSRRLHNKEFHAKQSIRQKQQEYDQAVKARLAQDCTVSGSKGSSSTTRSHAGAKHAQQLPELAATSGAILLSGPRAKKLQVRHPRPAQLPTPPRQLSRMPDDILLPDINSSDSVWRPYIINDDMADLLVDNQFEARASSGQSRARLSPLHALDAMKSREEQLEAWKAKRTKPLAAISNSNVLNRLPKPPVKRVAVLNKDSSATNKPSDVEYVDKENQQDHPSEKPPVVSKTSLSSKIPRAKQGSAGSSVRTTTESPAPGPVKAEAPVARKAALSASSLINMENQYDMLKGTLDTLKRESIRASVSGDVSKLSSAQVLGPHNAPEGDSTARIALPRPSGALLRESTLITGSSKNRTATAPSSSTELQPVFELGGRFETRSLAGLAAELFKDPRPSWNSLVKLLRRCVNQMTGKTRQYVDTSIKFEREASQQVESVQLASESAHKQLELELANAKHNAAQAAAAHKSAAASWQGELDWQKSEVSRLQRELTRMEAERDRAREDARRAASAQQELEGSVNGLKKETGAQLRELASDRGEALRALEGAKQAAEHRQHQLQEELQSMQACAQYAESRAAVAEAELQALRKQEAALQEAVAQGQERERLLLDQHRQ
ncbi:MAG: hypothetical protein FRX49_01908, partial [Trebouxia sp. A1-2]